MEFLIISQLIHFFMIGAALGIGIYYFMGKIKEDLNIKKDINKEDGRV